MAGGVTPRLHVEDLEVSRGGVPAVCDASFSLGDGEWLGMIGGNGSGKTSLLRAVAGRLPLDRGRISIDGVDCSRDRASRASWIGFAPEAAALPEILTPRELFSIAIRGSEPWRPEDDANGIAGALDIGRLADARIGTLSAGMRQRVAICSAFLGHNPIVFLDEPFNWLDPLIAYDLKQVLRLRVNQGLALVTALHELGTLTGFCDRGLLLCEGRVALTVGQQDLADGRRNPEAFDKVIVDQLRPRRGFGAPACR